MRNKKIIFLIPTLNEGGGERVVSELSINLPKHIHKIIVLFENKIAYPYDGELISLNLSISNNFFSKLSYFFIGFFKFKKIVAKQKPDYVISFGNSANIINILSNKKALTRIEQFMPAINGFWIKIYKILIKILFSKSYKIIVVSQKIANNLVEDFGIRKEKIKIIYNPLKVHAIRQLSKEPVGLEYREIFENPTIINAGRLTEQKGQWHLIKAFRAVKDEIKEAKLVILGNGELEPYLKELSKNLNLEKDIYLLGWQKNPFKFLRMADVFVLSSLYEGLPYAILEAMACGLPIISTDCDSGPKEILAPNMDINHRIEDVEYVDYGVLTPVFGKKFHKAKDSLTKSEHKLSEAIIQTLTNKKLLENLAKKSKERVDDFDIKNTIKKWDFLVDESKKL